MSIKVLHAADFHLDSPFAGLSGEQARLRRRESRELPGRLADYVNEQEVDVVLLAGDLFDGATVYRDTLDQLTEALDRMAARVFIAPGNHDCYTLRSPYASVSWPGNVHVFRTAEIERVELPELSCAVYGAAFTDAAQETGLLEGFSAPEDGLTRLMVLHGDLNGAEARYNPITREQIAASGLDYLALGHSHSFSGVQRAGRTAYAYAGCPEGRGFDETGEKGFLCGAVEPGRAELSFVPFALRHYAILTVDTTGRKPAEALRSAMPETAARDLCRVIFTGETDEEGVDLQALGDQFSGEFFSLELRDETRIRQDVWERAREDSLRGLFLRELQKQYENASEEERPEIERAVRFGLAALDRRDR